MSTTCALRVRNDLGGGTIDVDTTGAAYRGDACPACKETPLRVIGAGMEIASHDTYEAAGFCRVCGAPVGTIIATVPTIFGLEEDEAVLLSGRWRVY